MKRRVLSMLSVSAFAHDGACVDADNDCVCDTEGCGEAVHAWDGGVCTKCSASCTHDWLSGDTKAVCDICGETHNHNLTYDKDATNHWQICKDCPVDAAKKYNVTTHNMVVNGTVNECDVCGYTEHTHVWATEWSYDANYHWHACNDSSCTEKSDYAAHTMNPDGTTSSCSGCTYSHHVHVWADKMSWDATNHWYECTDSSCTEIKDFGEHHDNSSDNLCDVGTCDAEVASQTLSSLTITGLGTPAEGAAVDFSVSVAEDRYGAPSVKWNRVENLKKNTSTALGEGATFAAEKMYNVTIYVPINSKDEISESMTVTLDGKTIPFYQTNAAFDAAIKTYEGSNTVYMAKNLWTTSQRYIIVSVMYEKLGGTHTHTYGSDWIETSAKHYMMCTGCGQTKDSAYHYDNNKSGLCDVCGFDMKYFNKNATASNTGTGTATGTHTHTYSTDWVEDISNHWKQCTGCGAKTQTAAHADLNNTGKCDVCGFVMTAEAGHTHSFATEWTETFAQHYKVCSCGAKNEIAAHVDLNNTGKCDTCGYAMTTLSNNGIVAATGDSNAVFMWMAAFAVSVMGAATTVLFARKKRKE
ncbi:MAG: hypothetical protein IJD81_07255 [Oscillospiraceae bacterium]|nr:hypothetical protein [Oscillospiraceae bacterium]